MGRQRQAAIGIYGTHTDMPLVYLTGNTYQQATAAYTNIERHILGYENDDDARDLHDRIAETSLSWTYYNFDTRAVTGFTPTGAAALQALTQELRARFPELNRAISEAQLHKYLLRELLEIWGQNINPSQLTDNDIFHIDNRLIVLLQSTKTTRYHFIPVNLYNKEADSFDIGPVSFFCKSAIPFERYGVRTENAASIAQKLDGTLERYESIWVAVVGVPDREERRSSQVADLVVDVALCGPQLIFAASSFSAVGRLTGRSRPRNLDKISVANGLLTTDSRSVSPGLSWSVQIFNRAVIDSKDVFDSIGRRITGFLSVTSKTPMLDEAWCNSAYWFHEAIAAELDTVAITNFETAIEVLLRSESTKGSGRKILHAFEALLGVKADDPTKSGRFANVKQYAEAFVSLRSRILHGTLPTLNNDVYLSKAEIKSLCRDLILNCTMDIDLHISEATEAGVEPIDNVDNFLAWGLNRVELLEPPADAAHRP